MQYYLSQRNDVLSSNQFQTSTARSAGITKVSLRRKHRFCARNVSSTLRGGYARALSDLSDDVFALLRDNQFEFFVTRLPATVMSVACSLDSFSLD